MSEKIPLSNELYCIFTGLINHLEDKIKKENYKNLKSCMVEMKNKLITYWKLSLPTAEICMLLDPRQKTENFDSAIAKKEAVKRLQDIYISYKPHSFEETDNIQKSESKKNLSMFARFMKPGPIIEDTRNNNEIKNYLREPRISFEHNKNILVWWRDNKTAYPVLASIARDYLALMPASVYSEKSFSISGQIIKKREKQFSH